MTYEEILAAFESIDYDTILSAFDDKLTLLEWLTKLNDALINNAILEIQYLGYQNNVNSIVYTADFEIPINNYGNGIKKFIEDLKSLQTYEFDDAMKLCIKLIADANDVKELGNSAVIYTTGNGSYINTANVDNSFNVEYCTINKPSATDYQLSIHGLSAKYNSGYVTATRSFSYNSNKRHQTYATYLGLKIKNASGIIFTKQFTGAKT